MERFFFTNIGVVPEHSRPQTRLLDPAVNRPPRLGPKQQGSGKCYLHYIYPTLFVGSPSESLITSITSEPNHIRTPCPTFSGFPSKLSGSSFTWHRAHSQQGGLNYKTHGMVTLQYSRTFVWCPSLSFPGKASLLKLEHKLLYQNRKIQQLRCQRGTTRVQCEK